MARINDGDHEPDHREDPHHGDDHESSDDSSAGPRNAQQPREIPADELWAAAQAIHGEHQPEDQGPAEDPEQRTAQHGSEITDTWILQSLDGHSHLHEYDHEEIRRPGWHPLPSPPQSPSAHSHEPDPYDDVPQIHDPELLHDPEHFHELEQISATVEIPGVTEPDYDDDQEAAPQARRRESSRRGSSWAASSLRGSSRGLVIGQPPHANLLPPELAEAKRARGYRGYAIVVVVMAVAAMAALRYFAWLEAETENTQRIAAEERGEELRQAQDEFLEARELADQVDAIEAAAEAAGWTHIDWYEFLGELDRTLPDQVRITDLEIESASPLVGFPQLEEPGAPAEERAGIAIFTAESPQMPSVAEWLRGLEETPGFLDATPDEILEGDTDAGEEAYSVTITMRLNEDIFSTPEVAQ